MFYEAGNVCCTAYTVLDVLALSVSILDTARDANTKATWSTCITIVTPVVTLAVAVTP